MLLDLNKIKGLVMSYNQKRYLLTNAPTDCRPEEVDMLTEELVKVQHQLLQEIPNMIDAVEVLLNAVDAMSPKVDMPC